MTDNRNTLEWPSIDQFHREVCFRINRFLTVAEAAATVIQRAHRHQARDGERSDFHGGFRSSVHSWLLRSAVTTCEKLDGTNVGKLDDGTLLGRRMVIEPTATSYQRCDLSALRGYHTESVLSEFVALGGTAAPLRAALYGELCCNGGLYSYQRDGLAKSWQVFGALLEFENETSAQIYAREACAVGHICDTGEGTLVRVCNSRAFGEVVQRHGVPAVAAEAHVSLCTAVARWQEWMVGEHGEGLVLAVDTGEGRADLFKWKISREPQPSIFKSDGLVALVAELRAGANGKACLIDREIHEMLASLLAVATHPDSTSLLPVPAKTIKQTKGTPTSRLVVDDAMVQAAIASALTKFDDLEASFATHGQGGIANLVERLTAEVLCDADLVLPVEEEARKAATKQVSSSVLKRVGMAFGAWRRGMGG